MKKIFAFVIALSAPLLFPTFFAIVLVAGAAYVLPPVGLVAGVLTDSLYHTPGQSAPFGTLIGGFITLAAYGVHQFMKTRIMGG